MFDSDGSWSSVVNVRIKDKQLNAYNLTIADFHTYFVNRRTTTMPSQCGCTTPADRTSVGLFSRARRTELPTFSRQRSPSSTSWPRAKVSVQMAAPLSHHL
ncbi:polymorphic toxin-type HINT domain-containing protein [Rhizobium leguminosarum]|uniref:polymorphic toxin-type HINT domain-containing protein n=1 Tax=Rhizobium leguminosarum TaxID=384 RepID=UPI001FE15164|nr:polymorphic toxin-type HINT domain-containing protein [Rhizobium leguminosarum]